MENIFLDTGIFVKENFLEGKRINELLRLSEIKEVQIILSRITIAEIKNNYLKHLEKGLEFLGAFKNKLESRVLRNNNFGTPLFAKPIKSDLIDEFNTKLDDKLTKSNVVIIEYSELNIQLVFDKYFKAEFPFNSSNKKSEFPDAFAMALLEKWCETKKVKCTVFALDNDLKGYISSHLTIEFDYENYLDKKLKVQLETKQRLKTLENLFLANKSRIETKICEWYTDKLFVRAYIIILFLMKFII